MKFLPNSELDAVLEGLSSDEKELLKIRLMAERARTFDPNGFECYFELLFHLTLPEHHRYAIRETFKAYTEGRGIVIEMFRGAAKTTVFNTALASFIIGHKPDEPGLLIQVGDMIANDNSSTIAYHIEHNPGFKLVFPNIVPDKNRGWGANGYCVMDKSMSYPDWIGRLANKGTKDPTFVGLGYNSSSIIGKRPRWLILDDINDEKNTRSETRLREVKDILKGTIFPAANQANLRVVIGTPWNEADALHYCIQTGLFHHIKVPVYTKGKPTWPEVFDQNRIDTEQKLAGEIEFARMYLLDLEKTKGLVLKKQWLEPPFPHEDIKREWPAIMFIDYTSTANPEKEKTDYFALAVGQLVPGGRKIVISDGIYRRLTHLDAQKVAVKKIMEYPTLIVVGVEAVFAGNEYGQMLEQNQELIDNDIFPELCRGGPWQRTKGNRFERILADAFRKGTMVLSDVENELLTGLKDEWVNWQGDALADMGHDDALDAVFGVWHLGREWIAHGSAYKDFQYSPSNPLFRHKKTEYDGIAGFLGSNNG